MGHLLLNKLSPGLLSDPAAAATAMDQLERGQVLGMVRQTNKGSRPEQLKHLAWLPVMGAAGTGLDLRCCLQRTGGSRKCHREGDGREGAIV